MTHTQIQQKPTKFGSGQGPRPLASRSVPYGLVLSGLAVLAGVSGATGPAWAETTSETLWDPTARIEAADLQNALQVPLTVQAQSDQQGGSGFSVEELPSLPPELAAPELNESISQWDTAVFRGLDKVTARVEKFDAPVGGARNFGAFEIVVRQCNKRPPEDTPYTTAFVEVTETTLEGETKPLFAGWMFAASPGLNAVEHPVYDVWLIDCKMSAGAASAGSR